MSLRPKEVLTRTKQGQAAEGAGDGTGDDGVTSAAPELDDARTDLDLLIVASPVGRA